jgi:hypothetical protein
LTEIPFSGPKSHRSDANSAGFSMVCDVAF